MTYPEMSIRIKRHDNYDSPDSPGFLVPNFLHYDAIVEAVETLGHKDQRILLDRLGILCLYCARVGKPESKEDIAVKFQIKKAQSVDNNLSRVVEKLRDVLETQGWGEW